METRNVIGIENFGEKMIEHTLAIIKPDATARYLTSRIKTMIRSGYYPHMNRLGAGLEIAKQNYFSSLTEVQVRAFYAEHVGKPFFENLVQYMTSGPVVVLVLEGENAVVRWRKLMGATNPEEAELYTIRNTFGETVTRNSVHGSDSLESAAREIYFFEYRPAFPFLK